MVPSVDRKDALIYIDAVAGTARRLWKPPVQDGIYCYLRGDASVTLFSGDLSVRVSSADGSEVRSAHDGSISFDRATDGRHFHTRTAPLYLAAADRQGIPVKIEPGFGYYA